MNGPMSTSNVTLHRRPDRAGDLSGQTYDTESHGVRWEVESLARNGGGGRRTWIAYAYPWENGLCDFVAEEILASPVESVWALSRAEIGPAIEAASERLAAEGWGATAPR